MYHGNLSLAIWDTSFQIWNKTPSVHIVGPILTIFEIFQFIMTPLPFEYFSEKTTHVCFLNEGVLIIHFLI